MWYRSYYHNNQRGNRVIVSVNAIMRFRFCGDLDCPDWVLLEVSILSQLESGKVTVITKQILDNCLLMRVDEDMLLRVAEQNEDGISDLKGVVAAIHFIITNAAKYNVDESSLSQEIQQLGLPKANADIISGSFAQNKEALRSKYAAESYRASKVVSSSWRVDQLVASSNGEASGDYIAHIKLVVDTKPEIRPEDVQVTASVSPLKHIAFEVSEDKLNLLVHELTLAQKMLDNVDS